MELLKLSPLGRSLGLGNHMDSIFNEFFNPALCINESTDRLWNPVVDVYENDGRIVVKAEVPGVEKKDISVDIDHGLLTVKGERKNEEEINDERFYRKERVYGKFQRSFRLPEGTDYDKINADFKDGILTVTVPRMEEKKPTQIAIH